MRGGKSVRRAGSRQKPDRQGGRERKDEVGRMKDEDNPSEHPLHPPSFLLHPSAFILSLTPSLTVGLLPRAPARLPLSALTCPQYPFRPEASLYTSPKFGVSYHHEQVERTSSPGRLRGRGD